MAKKSSSPDAEHPPWTRAELRSARPAGEVFPGAFRETTQRRGRGPQKAPTKKLVSLRINPDTIATYRKTGRGWQSRIDEDLAKAAKRRGKQASV